MAHEMVHYPHIVAVVRKRYTYLGEGKANRLRTVIDRAS